MPTQAPSRMPGGRAPSDPQCPCPLPAAQLQLQLLRATPSTEQLPVQLQVQPQVQPPASTKKVPCRNSVRLGVGWFFGCCAAGACSPAVFACTLVQRELTPGDPGPGFRPGRRRFLCQLPLWFYIYVKVCRFRRRSPMHVRHS
jgi:hypothetical protein